MSKKLCGRVGKQLSKNIVKLLMKSGPIILVEDDPDDVDIFTEILKEFSVSNELLIFTNCNDAFNYLMETLDQPFIIFCDVNLPVLNGIDFKQQIDGNESLRRKSIPFVFYSTSTNQYIVNKAYTQMTVQGFFEKKSTYNEAKRMISSILDYWEECKHPNTK